MNDRKEKAVESSQNFAVNHFDGWIKKNRLLGERYPETLAHWMRARNALKDGALTPVQEELVCLGLKISTRCKNVETTTVRAMQAGATAQHIAEVVGMCMLIHGMVTYVECGVRALKTAEDYEADPEGVIKRVEALRGGEMSALRSYEERR
ncbi:MAG: carboxymuconolactone decarboxylase family protein [Deltaproteobacteria bacterium]|nr:carboxymuconolactone decarboxylase family protein [Deltaproteobacteria bacterium]